MTETASGAALPVEPDGTDLDPDCRLLLRAAAGEPSLDTYTVAEVRSLTAGTAREARTAIGEHPEAAPLRLEGARGALRGRLYTPSESRRTGGMLVYFHGGGFISGDLETHDDVCRQLTEGSGATLVSVEYRLAPEHPFPAQVEDAHAAFLAAWQLAPSVGCDPERIGVAGDSAGGNLAAAVASMDPEDGPHPCCQVLIYPWLDLTLQEPSVAMFGDGFGLQLSELEWFRDLWLDGADPMASSASPSLIGDLRGAAPTHLVIAGFDPLRDEAERYAQRLEDAGVPVSVQRHPDLIHGFVEFLGRSEAARRAVDQTAAEVRRLLAAQIRRTEES